MSQGYFVFIALVFAAAFLLMVGMTMPVFGENAQARRRLKAKALELGGADTDSFIARDLRKNEFKGLSDWERQLESSHFLAPLRQAITQSGNSIPAYRLVLISLLLGIALAGIGWLGTGLWYLGLALFALILPLPYLKIAFDRNRRLARFEEQLPDAIDSMKRALQAGYPFNETLNLVAQEMEDPVAGEFGRTFADLNYGNDAKLALMGLLSRVPSVNVMAMVVSVLIQRESGGNLAEVLEKLSRVIRDRFKFQRKVRTLTAEGRMSAWVLCMVPFGLFAILWVTSPDYLPILFQDPMGHKLLMGSAVGMVLGTLWIRKLIRIEV